MFSYIVEGDCNWIVVVKQSLWKVVEQLLVLHFTSEWSRIAHHAH